MKASETHRCKYDVGMNCFIHHSRRTQTGHAEPSVNLNHTTHHSLNMKIKSVTHIVLLQKASNFQKIPLLL